jgi:hypothetical protein
VIVQQGERPANHCAHCCLTFVTLGAWLPCWIGHCFGCLHCF